MNSLPYDVFDRNGGEKEKLAKQNLFGLIRDIFKLNASNKEDAQCDSWTGKNKFHILKMPIAKDRDDFAETAKRDKWIEEMLEKSSEEADVGEGIKSILDYLSKHHGDETREKLVQLGLSPKQMTAHDIAATMATTKTDQVCGESLSPASKNSQV